MIFMKKHINCLFFFACGMTLLMAVSCNTGTLETAQAEAYPAPFIQTVESDIKIYEEALSQKELTDEEQSRVESLLAEAQEVATMVAAPPPSKEQIEADRAELEAQIASEKIPPTPTPEIGILESGIFFEVHVPRRVIIENIWQGYVDGNLTRIYAGQLKPDARASTSLEKDVPQYGAVYTMTFLPDGSVETNLQSTEKETGALRIMESSKDYLTLTSAGTKALASQPFYYSLSNYQLADSLSKLDIPPVNKAYPEPSS